MISDDELRRLAEAARDADMAYRTRCSSETWGAVTKATHALTGAINPLVIIDLLDRLRDADAEWQPIETAPHDRWVLVYAAPAHGLNGFVCAALYNRDGGWCVDELRHATHWRPLPAAPEPTP